MDETRKRERLLVIPARGGSKRLPRKNILPFCGAPLMVHALRTALASSLFSKIHVSTDDPEIAEVAASHGLAPEFLRPTELADDHSTLLDVLRFISGRLAGPKGPFHSVTVLMPTAPLVLAEDLSGAHALFDDAAGRRPVLAVTRLPVPVEWAFRRAPDGTLSPLASAFLAARSQDLEDAWYDAGAFAIYAPEHLAAGSAIPPWLGHVLPRTRAVDIDTAEDLAMAELLFRAQRGDA
jgi:CMP-N-acetylneuraminic acid synthetase